MTRLRVITTSPSSTHPKGREVGRRLIRSAIRALKIGGRLYIGGANRGGVKSLIDDASDLIGDR